MYMNAKFDSDQSCQLLAKLIDTAPSLQTINISHQEGERKVKVLIDYAVETDDGIKQGSIKVFENRGDLKALKLYAQSLFKLNQMQKMAQNLQDVSSEFSKKIRLLIQMQMSAIQGQQFNVLDNQKKLLMMSIEHPLFNPDYMNLDEEILICERPTNKTAANEVKIIFKEHGDVPIEQPQLNEIYKKLNSLI